MPDLEKAILKARDAARESTRMLASYRALRLNMGTPETAHSEKIVDVEDWKSIISSEPAPKRGPVFVGVDLGGGTSMSAICFYWAETGRIECYGAFPAQPSLANRGKNDGVGDRYEKMKARGEVFIYPGRATNNVRFLTDMLKKIQDEEIGGMSADMYQMKMLEQALVAAGRPPDMVTWRRVGTGPQGFEDVQAFRSEVLEAHMRPTPSLALESAIKESQMRRDGNGNAALDKGRRKGRIDVLQAGILAVGMGRRWRVPSEEAYDFDVSDVVLTDEYFDESQYDEMVA